MDGDGIYQIDFQNYSHTGERILFLSPGQYFSVVTGSFMVQEIDLPDALLPRDAQLAEASRVLFTHIYAAGAIAPSPVLMDQASLTDADRLRTWLREAAQHWSTQRPLHPHITPRETSLLFDLRQHIEAHYNEQRPVREYVEALGLSSKWVNRITTSCIKRTIGELVRGRQLLEAKRKLFFSDKTIKEIAYELDFADPAYFSRFFSSHAGLSPAAFRKDYAALRPDPFLEDVWALVEQHFRHSRSVAFYAARLFMTPKTLSAKIKQRTGHSFKHLLTRRVASEARRLLLHSDQTVQDIAWALGFEEAPHFSHFFKQATGQAPHFFRQQR